MAVGTVDEYLSALEKSKLLGSEQLGKAQRLAGESSDAATLARALVRENLLSRWQAGILLALGQRAQLRLGKYKLIQRLGKGGMGTVFLAEHVTMNRRVALKIVPRSIAEDRASLDRFFAEARAIAALDHPNIVQAYSVDNEMDRYFIVMEFVDGQDLQRRVECEGPLEFNRAADYISQAAAGLAHAHARNLVHCDIKPSNLLVNNQGVIKILDLGLARLNRSDEPRGAASGEPAFGTVDYMAPEQALETANFDHRADIYSLGCTLYFLLTGHPPFPEGTLAQRIVKHQTQQPRDISLDRPDAPQQLVEICNRMMAKEPENRYQSVQEVYTALSPWQNGSNGLPGGRVPLAVKPLDDAALPTAGDDSLSFLDEPSKSPAASNGAKAVASSATATKPGKGGKQTMTKARTSGGIAAVLAGVSSFGRARLAWFNTTKRKIIGAVGGVALLAAVAGLASLPFVLSQPKPAARASQQPKAKPEAEKTLLEEDVNSPPDKSKEAESRKPDEAKTVALSKSTAEKEAPKPKAETLQPAHAAPSPQKSEPPKVVEPAKPAAQPQVAANVSPVAKTGANATSNSNAKPPSPEKKSEPVKPAEPAKKVSLEGLAEAVDLPPFGKNAADLVSLGKLDLDPKLTLDLQLLGGAMVAKGNPRFELSKEEGATSGWSVDMSTKNKDAVKIAKVSREGNECKIQWTTDARDKAALLRCCGLLFSCEKKTHFVALSKPKTAPPLPIDVDMGGTKASLKGATLPDAGMIRLQVLPLDKSLPKSQIRILPKGRMGRPVRGRSVEPIAGDTIPVKGRVIVVITKERTPSVAFDIAFEARGKDLALEMQAECEFHDRTAPFNWASLRMADARVGAFLMVNDSDKNPNKKNMQVQIQAAKLAKDQLKALGELGTDLDKKASIPFRVYVDLGDGQGKAAHQVVLYQSGQNDNPQAGGPKKNSKANSPRAAAPRNNKKGRPAADSDDLDLK